MGSGLFNSDDRSVHLDQQYTDSFNATTTTTNTSSLQGGQGNASLTLGASSPLDVPTLVAYAMIAGVALGGAYLLTRK